MTLQTEARRCDRLFEGRRRAATLAGGIAAALSETGDGKVLLVDMNVGQPGAPFFDEQTRFLFVGGSGTGEPSRRCGLKTLSGHGIVSGFEGGAHGLEKNSTT